MAKSADHVLGDSRLGDVEAQLEELTVDAWAPHVVHAGTRRPLQAGAKLRIGDIELAFRYE
jgi:hypothetical protein